MFFYATSSETIESVFVIVVCWFAKRLLFWQFQCLSSFIISMSWVSCFASILISTWQISNENNAYSLLISVNQSTRALQDKEELRWSLQPRFCLVVWLDCAGKKNFEEVDRVSFTFSKVPLIGSARAKHILPDLPYDYNALEPVISAEIMQVHHQKHHATYVNNLNQLEEKAQEALSKGDLRTTIALQVTNNLLFLYCCLGWSQILRWWTHQS